MGTKYSLGSVAFAATTVLALTLPGQSANAQSDVAEHRSRVISHWTADRRAAAQPRDLVIDNRGLGYLRRADGTLEPYGQQVAAVAPRARPGGGGNDTTAPAISNLDPAAGATIGAAYTFSATVTDASGIRSVDFVFTYPDGREQTLAASNSGGDTWSAALSGFTDGDWSYRVVAKDGAKKGGNTGESADTPFSVDTGGGGGNPPPGGGGDTITNAGWSGGGDVQRTMGRLFYEMPANARKKGPWNGYVCSGTVVTDNVSGRSVILTAAHCVYDDANKAFARNVLFIPDQDGTTGSGTDSNCGNDPIGCWVASFGVVDVNWTTRTFPDNIPWDYAFYVVSDSGAHQPGLNSASDILDAAVASGAGENVMSIDFTVPDVDDGAAGAGTPDFTHALGYSYSDDPNFMYCAEDMTTEGAFNWWLPSCGLSGGSSGGAWIQPLSGGTGPIISVNSWGYTTSPGMAGPKLNGTSAQCVFDAAINSAFPNNPRDGDAGYDVNCP